MSAIPRIDIDTLRQLLRLDPETGVLYWRATRGNARKDAAAGRFDEKGYLKLTILKGTYAAHRIVWALNYGEWPEGRLDHINGNRSDNRLSNLRRATALENSQNCKRSKRNTTGYKGVSFNKRDKVYRSRICVGEKRLYLGGFRTAEDAHEAYKAAAAKYHGDFSNAG